MPVFIHDAVRTPRGKARPDGSLAAIKPQDLVAGLVDALEVRNGEVRARAEMLALGCVGQVGAQGGHIALVSKFRSGLPDEMPAYTINNYCVSGLTAIGQAANAVAAGQMKFALAGGVESMSRVPFMGDKADFYSEAALPANARYMPVVVAADMLAMDENISRADLDAVTVTSHQKAAAAEADETAQRSRIAVKREDGTSALEKDEAVRAATSAQSLSSLAPAFAEVAGAYKAVVGERTIDHRHTIAHAPPVSDGAGLAFIGSEAGKPRAKILAYAEAGGDPRASLTAGFAAMDKALKQRELVAEKHGSHRVHGSLRRHHCHVPPRLRR